MKYHSTRDRERKVELSAGEAILKGLAEDGGLFVPDSIPALPEGLDVDAPYGHFAAKVLEPFFEGDELEDCLEEICSAAFDFPIPLHDLADSTVLELFHGPTSAFKDFGARFLAFSMERMLVKRDRRLCILVATSGDTGGAVASAFWKRRNLSVKVLFPKGRVARRQKQQLTCWGDNVSSYEVDGSFDDCQRMVKDAFVDPQYSSLLSSANSINLGRLLPQMVYYVYASMRYVKDKGRRPVIIIPSGNVGNCTGAYWAKAMGAPIERIVLAVNANRTIPDYLESGKYEPRSSVRTLANAMDVGAPSNMERIFDLFPTFDEVKANLSSWSVSDDEIRSTIRAVYEREGYVMCPHTACGEYVRATRFSDRDDVMLVSTAHPAKFDTVVEPLVAARVPMPKALEELMERPSEYRSIEADYHELF